MSSSFADPSPAPLAGPSGPGAATPSRIRVAASAVVAGALGLAPHLLHHAGPLAGAALFAGAGGSLLFGALGLIASVPFLVRVRRRCGNWRVPGMLLALFAAVFALSTFVIAPAITGSDTSSGTSAPATAPAAPGQTNPSPPPSGHAAHHR